MNRTCILPPFFLRHAYCHANWALSSFRNLDALCDYIVCNFIQDCKHRRHTWNSSYAKRLHEDIHMLLLCSLLNSAIILHCRLQTS